METSPFGPGVEIGRYRLEETLGKGGMGEVFKAEDTVLGRRVAIKVLPMEVVATPERLARFEREGRMAASLSHPNLVQIHDVGEHQGIPFIVQEFVDGESLEDILARGPVEPKQAADWCRQAALGLFAVHESGIIHRDIKPGNIMVGQDGRVRVLDFGLATMESGRPVEWNANASKATLTREGFILGTAHYMSPEQAMGKRLDARSDIFSLGVVLYELLTGIRPFEGDSSIDVLHAVLHEDPAPFAPGFGIPADLAGLVYRMLDKEPGRRPASMKDLAEALAALYRKSRTMTPTGLSAGHRPGRSADADTRTHTTVTAVRPAPRRVPVIAAIAVICLCLAALWLWRWLHSAPAPAPAPLSPVQLTASAGLDIFPSFSPDGANLVFSSNRSGGFELYIRALAAGGREVQLTDDGQENLQPAWSPDGTLIAYHSKKRGGVWILPALGGNARQVSSFGSRPAWSPDGKLLAFESGPLVDLSASYLGALPPSVIWVTRVDGSEARAVTDVGRPAGGHGSPSFSPGGDKIVFSTYERALKGELWTVDLRTKELSQVAKGTGFRLDPVFSSTGDEIFFGGVSEGWNYAVFRVPVSKKTGAGTGEPREIFNFGLGPIRQLAVSPDGKRLAYSSLTMASNLVSQKVDPKSGEPLGAPVPVTRETGRNSRPAFSPDGRRLALTKWKLGSRQDIWICDLDGNNPVQRTTHPADDDFAQWFPSGEKLAFVSHRLGYAAFFTHDLTTSQEGVAADLGRGVDFLRLGPDGLRFSFHRAPEGGVINTWVGELGKGAPRQITFDQEMAGFACWSPDGKVLALEVKRGEDVQVGLVSSGGGAIKLLTSEPGQAWPYTFSPDGSRIAFAGLRNGLWNIYWIPLGGGNSVPVSRNSRLNAYLRYPAWSPAGDRIVYEHAETYGNVWVLENFR